MFVRLLILATMRDTGVQSKAASVTSEVVGFDSKADARNAKRRLEDAPLAEQRAYMNVTVLPIDDIEN